MGSTSSRIGDNSGVEIAETIVDRLESLNDRVQTEVNLIGIARSLGQSLIQAVAIKYGASQDLATLRMRDQEFANMQNALRSGATMHTSLLNSAQGQLNYLTYKQNNRGYSGAGNVTLRLVATNAEMFEEQVEQNLRISGQVRTNAAADQQRIKARYGV